MQSQISALLREIRIGAHRVRLAVRRILIEAPQGRQRLLALHLHHAAGKEHLGCHGGNQQTFLCLVQLMTCAHFAEPLQMTPLVRQDFIDSTANLLVRRQHQRPLIYTDRPAFHLHCDAKRLTFVLHNHSPHLFHSLSPDIHRVFHTCPQSYPQYPQVVDNKLLFFPHHPQSYPHRMWMALKLAKFTPGQENQGLQRFSKNERLLRRKA